MNVVTVILSILFIISIGYIIIWGFRLLSPKSFLLSLAYSYGLGVGLISFQLYIYSQMHISWQKEFLIIPWIILMAIILIKNIKRVKIKFPKKPKLGKFEYVLLVGIFLTICYVIFEALIRPVSAWDAWAVWLFRSKMFFMEGEILTKAFSYEQSGYPLVINLLGTFIYIMLGKVDDTAVLLTSSFFYLSLALLFFATLRKKINFRYALLFTFLFMTTQNFVRHGGRMEAGLADLPVGYYAFSSLTLLLSYLQDNNKKTIILMGVFLGILGLIKYEGIPFGIAIVFFALLHIYKEKLYMHLFYLLFWLIPLIDWQIFRSIHDPQQTYFSAHAFVFSFKKIITSIFGMIKEFITVKSWSLLWIAYFYSLFFIQVRYDKELIVVNSIILFQLSVYMFMYMFTAGNSPESSGERLLVHVAPMVFYAITLIINRSHYLPKRIFK